MEGSRICPRDPGDHRPSLLRELDSGKFAQVTQGLGKRNRRDVECQFVARLKVRGKIEHKGHFDRAVGLLLRFRLQVPKDANEVRVTEFDPRQNQSFELFTKRRSRPTWLRRRQPAAREKKSKEKGRKDHRQWAGSTHADKVANVTEQ